MPVRPSVLKQPLFRQMRNGGNTIHNNNGRHNIGKSLNDTMLGKTDWLSDLILVTK